MEITNDSLEFTSEDMIAWRAFLRTQTGQRLIPKVLELAPALLSKGDTNEVLIRNGEMIGYQNFVKNLLALSNPPPELKPESAAYPDPTDDEAWADGQKLTT